MRKICVCIFLCVSLLFGCIRDVSNSAQESKNDDILSSTSLFVEENTAISSSINQSSEQNVVESSSAISILSSVSSDVISQSSENNLADSVPITSNSDLITESSSSTDPEIFDLILSFMDSNGCPIVNEPVTCLFPDGSASILGNTDELGVIHFSPSAIGVYGFELSEFDHSLRPQPLGLGLGPLYFEYSLTELTDTREASFTVEVYPIIEQSISDNCVVFYLYDQNNIPLAGKRIFYYVIPEGESCDDENTITEKLHLGLTDEEGKVVLHNPSVLGEYVFLYPHPNNRSISLEFSVVLESIENIQKFVLNAAEY